MPSSGAETFERISGQAIRQTRERSSRSAAPAIARERFRTR
jgi:hypothetical protein